MSCTPPICLWPELDLVQFSLQLVEEALDGIFFEQFLEPVLGVLELLIQRGLPLPRVPWIVLDRKKQTEHIGADVDEAGQEEQV